MNKSVGQQLRQRREERRLTLEQVAQATHIRPHYLQALEEGEWARLPSRAQARGFFRAYAGYLDLDPEQLFQIAETEQQPAVPDTPTPQDFTQEAEAARPAPIEAEPATTKQAASPAVTGQAAVAESLQRIGQALRQRREVLGLSLEEVERHTHLRRFYLLALEAGDLEKLPPPVQARGMIKNYAAFLGLDPDPLLLQYADGLQAQLRLRRPAGDTAGQSRQLTPRNTLSRPRLFSSDLLLAALIILALGSFTLWGAVRVYRLGQAVTPTPSAPSIVEVLLAPPSPTATPTAGQETPTVPATLSLLPAATSGIVEAPEPGSAGRIQINISVRQRTWMRVVVDGRTEFEGRVIPGSAYQFAGRNQIEILTGNGAALQVFFNQQDLGPLGNFGQVVDRIFAPQGIITATPTITLTPTATLRPSATPSPTRTLRPGEATMPPLP